MIVRGDEIWNQLDKRFQLFDKNAGDPGPCDVLAIAFYEPDIHCMQSVIDRVGPQVQNLWVYVSEPTAPVLMSFARRQQSRVQFFGDAVPNEECANWNTVISWFLNPVNYYAVKPWAQDLLDQIQSPLGPRPFMFDCLLGHRRRHRDILWNHLLERPDRHKFFSTYFKDDHQIEQDGIWNLPYRRKGVHNVIMDDGTELNRYSLVPVQIYNDSFYSMVVETTCYNQHNQYTEKVAKPILAKRPFIVFAGQHYLRNLRQLGFRTFSPIIDEAYDSEPDLQARFRLIVRAIDDLLRQDPMQVYSLLTDVLAHNHRHFLETDWWAPAKQRLDLE